MTVVKTISVDPVTKIADEWKPDDERPFAKHRRLHIINTSATTAYIGINQGLTIQNGWSLIQNATLLIEHYLGEVWAISSSSGTACNIGIIEE